MIGTIAIIWKEGVLRDKGKIVAGPDEKIYVNLLQAERFVREGKAVYPPRK